MCGASSFAFLLYLLSDVIQTKVQSSMDRVSCIMEKYTTDQGKISVKLDKIDDFMSDINSVRSEITNMRDMNNKYIPYIMPTEPINTPQIISNTPRFTALYDKNTNSIIIDEIK